MTSVVRAGRVAFLDALETEVARARGDELRLSAAIIRAVAGETRALEAALLELVAGPVYAVRSASYAIVLPGLGRAEALGVLAKVEARCGARGFAVELEPGERAVELAARLLASRSLPGSVPAGAWPSRGPGAARD